MPLLRFGTTAFLLSLTLSTSAVAQSADLIYGRVTTADDRVVEGFIRCDQNEGSWFDIVDANKELPRRNVNQGEELGGRHYDHCEQGLHIRWGHVAWHDGCGSGSAQGNIRFGHIAQLEVVDRNEARLTLKSGAIVDLRANSTDLGRSNRGVFVAGADGVEELEWDDITNIEFMRLGEGGSSAFGDRLYGTLRTRDGLEFTGYVTWDMDEIFGADTLDDRSSDGNQEIPFETIESIARRSSSSSTVTLVSGERLTLRGSNDVNDENRGIAVADPAFGQVRLDWDDFESVRFLPPPIQPLAFPGDMPLRGTVVTADGRRFTGQIRWDNDEEYTWEHLDGEDGGLDFDIEFGLIRSIARLSSRAARVTVADGRSFDLSGSTDVNENNRGVVVTLADGSMVLIDWDDFDRVDFGT